MAPPAPIPPINHPRQPRDQRRHRNRRAGPDLTILPCQLTQLAEDRTDRRRWRHGRGSWDELSALTP